MPFYPPPQNGPLVLLPHIHVPIMSLWVASGFHEDSLPLPQPCVPRIHLCMCWHAGWSVQTCWQVKEKWVVIASTMSVFVEILGSFLCSATDFLKPCRNIPVGISFCQIWYRLNDMLKHWLCRLGCRWAVEVLADRHISPQNTYDQRLVFLVVSLLPTLTTGYTLATHQEPSAVWQSWGKKPTKKPLLHCLLSPGCIWFYLFIALEAYTFWLLPLS